MEGPPSIPHADARHTREWPWVDARPHVERTFRSACPAPATSSFGAAEIALVASAMAMAARTARTDRAAAVTRISARG